MHDESRDYIARWSTKKAISVIELGSRHTWGEPIRGLFPNAVYFGVDAQEGEGVDEIANAATWQPSEPAALVVCSEVFEHTPRWSEIVVNSAAMLKPGGRAVFTCAGPGRAVHGWTDNPDEPNYYCNLDPTALFASMTRAGFIEIETSMVKHSTALGGTDTRGTGVRP